MSKMKTRLGAVLNNRCPKCYEGKLFSAKAYDLPRVSEMPATCPVCEEDFEREPGFYFGAAYVSYALTVALWVSLFVALTCFDWWGWMVFSFFDDVPFFLLTGIALLILLMPVLLRLSRSIWIHMLTKRG
jgi:uncharacterized protein (DUF983 family)